jgi:bacillithiol system protein YtxJ
MNWINLAIPQQIEEIRQKSYQKPQVIFKHSTRCSISNMALNRLERSTLPDNIDFHYLDLLIHKDISNKIAEEFGVYHQSPQVLLIKDGKSVYDESQMAITMDEIKEAAALN